MKKISGTATSQPSVLSCKGMRMIVLNYFNSANTTNLLRNRFLKMIHSNISTVCFTLVNLIRLLILGFFKLWMIIKSNNPKLDTKLKRMSNAIILDRDILPTATPKKYPCALCKQQTPPMKAGLSF